MRMFERPLVNRMRDMNAPFSQWLNPLLELVDQASVAVMAVYNTDFEVHRKADASPVTAADLAAEAIITAGLRTLTPHIPVIGEEASSDGLAPLAADTFWLIDPVDGTREFMDRNGEFTVNVALVHHGEPQLGVVAAPALNEVFWGVNTEAMRGAWWRSAPNDKPIPIQCTPPPHEGIRVLRSRNHGDPGALDVFLRDYTIGTETAVGSSLKFCRMAQGLADLYPRFGPTMAWDTAAAHAVLAGAGGRICQVDGQDLRYDAKQLKNPHFVAWGLLMPPSSR